MPKIAHEPLTHSSHFYLTYCEYIFEIVMCCTVFLIEIKRRWQSTKVSTDDGAAGLTDAVKLL